MGKFTLVNEIECDTDTFWKVFFDRTFNETLFRDRLQFPRFEISQQTEDDKEIRRKVNGQPKMDLPGPVAKLLGNSFSFVEDGTFDKATKTWRWRMTPSTLADKVRNEGVVRCEAAGPGRCKRISEITVEAKMFGVGGLLESTAEKNFRHGWENSATFMNEWIRSGKAK